MSKSHSVAIALCTLSALSLFGPPAAAPQGVAVSETDITVAGEDVLTTGNATPVYIRGTGLNNPADRIVKLGDTVLVDDTNRGLTLTILDGATHAHVSSTNYDTWDFDTESDAMAAALAAMTDGQIGVLTSYDAFEGHLTPSLQAEARRLGLFRLAGVLASQHESNRRHPYAAIFHASGGANHKAVEILQSNSTAAPYAILATWLIGDGFVGQAVTAADSLRCSGVPGVPGPRYTDCNDGTVVDNHTGLFWLKDASCDVLGPNADGTGTWQEALDAAAALADGMCGLVDGSAAGDWRLARIWELCSGWEDPSVACPTSAKSDSLINTRFSNPAVSNAEGSAKWSEGDPFVGVQSTFVWSSTELSATDCWGATLSNGDVIAVAKTQVVLIWPVRGGL